MMCGPTIGNRMPSDRAAKSKMSMESSLAVAAAPPVNTRMETYLVPAPNHDSHFSSAACVNPSTASGPAAESENTARASALRWIRFQIYCVHV